MSEIMPNSSASLDVQTGRNASRMRRSQLVSGKAGLPPAKERVRMNQETARPTGVFPLEAIPSAASIAQSSATAIRNTGQAPMTGRDASRARRAGLVQGKKGILNQKASVTTTVPSPVSLPEVNVNTMPGMNAGRLAAQAARNERTNSGQAKDGAARPSGRLRNAYPIQYPPKVTESKSYAGHKVTGVRIGCGENVTGDERGAALQVTGIQYIGTEAGYNPREGGIKVGASKTVAGQIVTGSQVRSKISITGDESNPALRITGECDQELVDDMLPRREQGSYAPMQFQRQNDPHGHTVFGANLARTVRSIGSRNRGIVYSSEESAGGRPITGTAVGRSELTTGDESGSCRDVTGNQYLMPAAKQPLCETNGRDLPQKVGVSHTLQGARTTGTQVGQRIRQRGSITGTEEKGICQNISGTEYSGAEQYACHCGTPPARAGNGNVPHAITWGGQNVTGVDIEHNENVTGDEQGVCGVITGTPYAGPNQYQAFCSAENEDKAGRRVLSQMASGSHVSGDIPLNVERVSGTQRGSEHEITGTRYYVANPGKDVSSDLIERIKQINDSFSIRSPQRESQVRTGIDAVNAPTAESRITGTFSAGVGKITGNQEFHFNPRPKAEVSADKSRVTGEGRVEGRTITGSAWITKDNVTGTEGYIAAERNPSQRQGDLHAWAGARKFKAKATHPEPTHHVTGMVGWSPKASAPITVSGGGRG
jgi:hypothetical protein